MKNETPKYVVFFILTKSAVTLFSSCIFKADLGLPTLHSNQTHPYQAAI